VDHRTGTWSVVAGSLPAGLTLSGYTISGKPSTYGLSTFTLGFVDAAGHAVRAQATMNVDESVPGNPSPTPGSWTADQVPAPPDDASSTGATPTISCAGVCAGTYLYQDGSGDYRYALLSLSGSGGWRVSQPPLPSGVSPDVADGNISDVSCGSDGYCAVMAPYEQSTESEGIQIMWTFANGEWTAVQAPLPAGVLATQFLGASYDSLTCGQDVCSALGWYASSTGQPTWLTVLWTWTPATGWTATTAPLPSDASGSVDTGAIVVSCGTDVCVATDSYRDTSDNWQDVLWTWTPTTGWSATEAPLPADTNTDDAYIEASCGAGVCAAIDYFSDDGSDLLAPVIWTWNGTAWSAQTNIPVPADTDGTTGVDRVSCGGTTCVISGIYYTSPDLNLVSLLWTWTAGAPGWSYEMPAAPGNAKAGTTNYNFVSCGVDVCAAEGTYTDTSGAVIMALWTSEDGTTWTGQSWPSASNANPGPSGNGYLSGVSCGDSLCAAYFYSTVNGTYLDALEQWSPQGGWTETSPTQLPANAAPTPHETLYGVSCGSGTCVSSGSYDTDTGSDQQGLLWTYEAP
jgi:hypothetical protein